MVFSLCSLVERMVFSLRSLYAILVILVKNCSEQLVLLFSSPELRPIFGSYYGKGEGDSPTGGTPQGVGGVRRGQAEVKRENGTQGLGRRGTVMGGHAG